jgi:hypothetical protein
VVHFSRLYPLSRDCVDGVLRTEGKLLHPPPAGCGPRRVASRATGGLERSARALAEIARSIALHNFSARFGYGVAGGCGWGPGEGSAGACGQGGSWLAYRLGVKGAGLGVGIGRVRKRGAAWGFC